MKLHLAKLFLVLSFCIYGCSQKTELFIGKWQIVVVEESSEKVELKDNWIHINANGTFTSFDGELNKTESGNWNYDKNTGQLFINGDQDSEDSIWHLQTQNDTLIFKSTSDPVYLYAVEYNE